MEHLGTVVVALISSVVSIASTLGVGAYFLGSRFMTKAEHRSVCGDQEKDFCRQITAVNKRLDTSEKQRATDVKSLKDDIGAVGEDVKMLLGKMIPQAGGQ